MKTKKSITIDKIITEADPGGQLSSCIRQAVSLAMEENVTVEMTHNSKTYTACPSSIIALIQVEAQSQRDESDA